MDRPDWRFPDVAVVDGYSQIGVAVRSSDSGGRAAKELTGVPVTSLPALGTVSRVATWY